MDSGLLTGPELARVLGVRPPTVRSWVRRGQLAPAGLDSRGRPLYRQTAGARCLHARQHPETANAA